MCVDPWASPCGTTQSGPATEEIERAEETEIAAQSGEGLQKEDNSSEPPCSCRCRVTVSTDMKEKEKQKKREKRVHRADQLLASLRL